MKNLKRTLHISLALLMLTIGLLGIVLPLLNGTLFIVIALILLSFENRKLEQFLERWMSKNKTAHRVYEKLNSLLRRWFA